MLKAYTIYIVMLFVGIIGLIYGNDNGAKLFYRIFGFDILEIFNDHKRLKEYIAISISIISMIMVFYSIISGAWAFIFPGVSEEEKSLLQESLACIRYSKSCDVTPCLQLFESKFIASPRYELLVKESNARGEALQCQTASPPPFPPQNHVPQPSGELINPDPSKTPSEDRQIDAFNYPPASAQPTDGKLSSAAPPKAPPADPRIEALKDWLNPGTSKTARTRIPIAVTDESTSLSDYGLTKYVIDTLHEAGFDNIVGRSESILKLEISDVRFRANISRFPQGDDIWTGEFSLKIRLEGFNYSALYTANIFADGHASDEKAAREEALDNVRRKIRTIIDDHVLN